MWLGIKMYTIITFTNYRQLKEMGKYLKLQQSYIHAKYLEMNIIGDVMENFQIPVESAKGSVGNAKTNHIS